MSFWSELKRRNVYKVGAAYLVMAWILAQAVDIVLPTFNAPPWVGQTIILFLILGLPIVLLVAWAYEITPEGIKKTASVPVAASMTSTTGQRLNYVIIGLMAVAIVFLAVDNYLLDDDAQSVAPAAADAGAPEEAVPPAAASAPAEGGALRNSVAVLPFDNLSPDENNAFFAAGIHEEVLNHLAKLSNLSVISRTSMMRYADSNLTLPEIARELNVETVVEGSVRYAGARVRVTAQLVDAATDRHLWSETYEREFADIFAIQADIAMNIANALEAEFTPVEQQSIERRPTESLEAYELYLAALAAARDNDIRKALELLERALAVDPAFVEAWIGKANQLGVLIAFIAEGFAEQKQAIVDAAMRAIELAPDDGSGYLALGFALGQQGEWLRAEQEYRRAVDLGVKPENMGQYFLLQMAVGNFAGARDSLEAQVRIDPLFQGAAGFLLAAYEMVGDSASRRAAYERGETLFGQWWGDTIEFVLRQGDRDVEFLRSLRPTDDIIAFGQRNLDTPEAALEEIRAAYAAGRLRTPAALFQLANWAAFFGDPELALTMMRQTILEQLEVSILYMWLPLYDDARKLPAFKDLIAELGLVKHWREYGWPEFCRPLGDDDFECE